LVNSLSLKRNILLTKLLQFMQKSPFCNQGFIPSRLLLPVRGVDEKRKTRTFRIPWKKSLLIMKLTGILLLAFCLQLSAKSIAQSVTYSGQNIPLKQIFSVIENQTGYMVSGNMELLRVSNPVTISVQSMPIENFLSLVFKNQPLNYHLVGKDIIISRKPYIPPTQAALKGRIADTLGNALPGATIRVKGKNTSTISDSEGNFTIDAVPGDVLQVSFVGFFKKEVKINSLAPLAIFLVPQSVNMAAVAITVNTGYQSIPRERATGSYAIIGADQLNNKLRPDLQAALEAQAPGLALTKDGRIEIRGVSTFNAETSPLIIVDGYPITGGLESINIDNVENVTVLKDAVAASIYGSRSSNGVIVITTKKGKSGTMSVGYRGSFGLIQKPDLSYLNRSSTADYIDAEAELYSQSSFLYQAQYAGYSYLSKVNYLLVAKDLGLMPATEVDAEIESMKQNDGLGQLQKYLFRNQLSQQHNISLSGGSDKNTTAATIKYVTNRGNTLYTENDRAIFDLRNDWKPHKNVTVKLFSNINYSTSKAPLRTIPSFLEYYSATMFHPYDLVVNPETGQYQDIFATNPAKIDRYANMDGLKPMDYNPLEDLGNEITRTQNFQMRLGGSINVKLMEGLNIEGGGVWIRGNSVTKSISGKDSYRMRLAYNDGTSISNPSKHYIPDGDMVQEGRTLNQTYTIRGQLNFNRSFGKHQVMAIAGTEVTRDVWDNNTYPTRFGYDDQSGTFATFNYADYNAGIYNSDMLGTSKPQNPVNIGQYNYRDNRFVSWYANGSYEFDYRFLVSGSIRLDQTNFFGTNPDYRYKPLWSVGGTYKLSNEAFFNVPWITKLYLRSSYGINGNISLNSGPFLIISPGSFSNYTGDIAYNISSPPNNSLRWEKTSTNNYGIDASFFNNRLNVTADYYFRKSVDLLAPDMVDPTIGYTSLTKNVGQINNKGIELSINADILRDKEVGWNVLATYASNKNEVISYNVNYLYATSFLTSVNRENYPANAVFSYRNAGLDENGSPIYYNQKGDKVNGGAIGVDDLVYSGTLRPKNTFGLTNNLSYKSLQLSVMFVAKTGNVLRRTAFDGTNIQHKDVAKRWRQPGDEKTTIYPKLSAFSLDAFYFPFSDTFVESGDFLKLRDVTLAYNLPKKVIGKSFFKNASINFEARNLWMWTANSDHIDPEAIELIDPGSAQAELGFTPFRPMPEYYLGLRFQF